MPLNFLKRINRQFSFVAVFLLASLSSFAQQSDAGEFLMLRQNAFKLSMDKKWNEALPLWEQLTERNPVSGELVANLANTYYNTTQYTKAIEAYKKQIELGYGIVYNAAYNIACCYALIGNKEPALQWLQKAFDMGFRSYTKAQTDEDFKSIKDEPRFAKIVAMEDVSKMSRTEAWRYDMEILKREVMRKAVFRRELSLEDFNRQYDALHKTIEKKTDAQMILELMKLMVAVDDGHTAVFPVSRKEFQLTLPLQFYFFREGLYIIAADPKYKHLLGSKVVAFEKKSVEEVSKTVSPYLSRDNEMGVLQNLPGAMRYTNALFALGLTPDAAKVELQLEDINGKPFTAVVMADNTAPRVDHKSVPENWVTLHQTLSNPVPLYLKNTKTFYWFEALPDEKTVYLQWNAVLNDKAESLNQFTDRLMKFINDNKADKLVIDLRWNNGGNTMLVPYFIQSLIKNERINKRGHLFVITGRRTFSAAQNLATFLEKQTASIFVGEPTGSRPNFVGEEDFITLPYSKLAINVSDLYWQSSWPGDKRKWIQPMLYVPPTFKAYKENRDEALEAIVKLPAGWL